MTKLNCQSEVSQQKDSAKIIPPSYRFDLHIKEDLIEEFARLEGYDKIPEADSLIPCLPVGSKNVQSYYHKENQIAEVLASQGFFQSINSSFISQKFSNNVIKNDKNLSDDVTPKSSVQDLFFTYLEQDKKRWDPVFVKNPLSSEYDMMRISMVPSLFKNAVHNLNMAPIMVVYLSWVMFFPKKNPIRNILGWLCWLGGRKEDCGLRMKIAPVFMI